MSALHEAADAATASGREMADELSDRIGVKRLIEIWERHQVDVRRWAEEVKAEHAADIDRLRFENAALLERIAMAREWRAAAVERLKFCRRQLEAAEDAPAPWWDAQHNTIDSMTDRINVIDALFPEVRDEAAALGAGLREVLSQALKEEGA
ncbi:MAG: hypothetical protein AAFQ90_12710 [Pseudomonadota bacterium]